MPVSPTLGSGDPDGSFSLEIDDDILADAVASVERRLEKKEPEPPVAQPEPDAITTLVDEIVVDVDFEEDAEDTSLTELREELEQKRLEIEGMRTQGRALKRRLKKTRHELVAMSRRLRDTEMERRKTWEQNRNLEQVVRGLKKRIVLLDEEMERQHQRMLRDIDHARQFGHEDTVRQFIPVADDLERALLHVEGDPSDLREGVSLVSRHFQRVLKRLGVEPIAAEPGMSFEPEFHEALLRVPKEGQKDECIERVIRPGYLLHGRMFRAAQVMVATPPPTQSVVERPVPFEADDGAGNGVAATEE